MEYTLEFFDDSGEKTLVVGKFGAVHDALNHAAQLGARDFCWDGFLLSGQQDLCYCGMFGTFGIVDNAYFASKFQ